VITSIAIIMIYIAYRLATGPMLFARLRGEWPKPDSSGGATSPWGGGDYR